MTVVMLMITIGKLANGIYKCNALGLNAFTFQQKNFIKLDLKLYNKLTHMKESTELPPDPFLRTNLHPMEKPLEQIATDI